MLRAVFIFASLTHLLTILVGLFAPGYQYGSLEMWATAFMVYTFIGLVLSRQTRWLGTLIGGLALLVLARFGWAWIWGDQVEVVQTTVVLLLYFPVMLICGLLLGWPPKVGYALIGAVAILHVVLGTARMGEPVLGLTDYRFSVVFLVVFGLIARFVDLWRENLLQLARTEKRADQLAVQASTDSLTGVMSRSAGVDLLQQALRDDLQVTVGLIDLDHFKKINDQYGHIEGDRVLKLVVKSISRVMRKSDGIARWGGDEFLLIMRNTTDEEGREAADRLREAVASDSDRIQGVTLSIGIASQRADESVESLLSRADRVLYAAKAHGRNRVETTERDDSSRDDES